MPEMQHGSHAPSASGRAPASAASGCGPASSLSGHVGAPQTFSPQSMYANSQTVSAGHAQTVMTPLTQHGSRLNPASATASAGLLSASSTSLQPAGPTPTTTMPKTLIIGPRANPSHPVFGRRIVDFYARRGTHAKLSGGRREPPGYLRRFPVPSVSEMVGISAHSVPRRRDWSRNPLTGDQRRCRTAIGGDAPCQSGRKRP